MLLTFFNGNINYVVSVWADAPTETEAPVETDAPTETDAPVYTWTIEYLNTYPGGDSDDTFEGSIDLTFKDTTVTMEYTFATFDEACLQGPDLSLSANSCGIHIHTVNSLVRPRKFI